jgi:hypothetical protein
MMGHAADELPVVAGARALAIDLRPHRSDPRILAPRVGGGAEQHETSYQSEPETHTAHGNLLFLRFGQFASVKGFLAVIPLLSPKRTPPPTGVFERMPM